MGPTACHGNGGTIYLHGAPEGVFSSRDLSRYDLLAGVNSIYKLSGAGERPAAEGATFPGLRRRLHTVNKKMRLFFVAR